MVTGLLFSVEWIEDLQQNPFSVVCSQGTSLHIVNNFNDEDFFCLDICSIDFQLEHSKQQKILSGGKTTAHEPAQLTKVVLERVYLKRTLKNGCFTSRLLTIQAVTRGEHRGGGKEAFM